MKFALVPMLALLLAASGIVPASFTQTGRESFPRPSIEIQQYRIEATLIPDTHQIEAAATIQFLPKESTDYIVLELNENLWMQKVLNEEGIELEFEDGALGPGILTVLFSRPLETGTNVTIRLEYKGGFDRDPFSRIYSRDESNAYIGMEGSYLMYGAKWIPVDRLMGTRVPTTMEVTVPLGMTVIGPGNQQPVVTRGVNETFIWNADTPILAGSMVAGQYFQRELQVGDFTLECFAKAENLESIQQEAKTAAGILDFYRKTYGPSASGSRYRLVEVDDRLKNQHGMLGTIFITRGELTQPSDSSRDLARRIAYQWWQETVGVRAATDLWLEDGMAYYSAAKYRQKENGTDAYKEEIEDLAILALKFESASSVREGLDLGYRSDRYESVVAGKGAWVLNMLSGLLGDSKFDSLVQQYIQECSGMGGSTGEFRKIAESLYGKELGWFFTQWVDATGVPALESDYVVYKTVDGFRITGAIKQDRDLFRTPVEVAVISDSEETIERIDLSGRSTSFDMTSFSNPEKIVLDPNNKLLRDSSELRASVQLALGNDRKDQNDYIGAVRAYESALKINPQRSLAHFRLAEIFYEQFNLQSAADSFRDALNGDMNPRWIEVWCYIYLGKIYDILAQRARAMAEYQKAINTKDDTNGAQAEANKWIATPFVRKRTILGE
ncbi:MAG: tetratricopeptide repeat protein [Acidobacteria bacterium]|nr:tetratricopeptide repeat protein [Acidobacteriota bacterium]